MDEARMSHLARELEISCSAAIQEVAKCSKIKVDVEPILTGGQPQNRIRFDQEAHVGLLIPFEGSWSGSASVLLPWIGVQRLWANSRIAAPLTPNDLTSEHIRWLLEIGELTMLGFTNRVGKNIQKATEVRSAKLAIDMPLVMVQTTTIDAIRRKMGVFPFRIAVQVADINLEGTILLAVRECHLRRINATGEVAA